MPPAFNLSQDQTLQFSLFQPLARPILRDELFSSKMLVVVSGTNQRRQSTHTSYLNELLKICRQTHRLSRRSSQILQHPAVLSTFPADASSVSAALPVQQADHFTSIRLRVKHFVRVARSILPLDPSVRSSRSLLPSEPTILHHPCRLSSHIRKLDNSKCESWWMRRARPPCQVPDTARRALSTLQRSRCRRVDKRSASTISLAAGALLAAATRIWNCWRASSLL
jgi:hypothetical protein